MVSPLTENRKKKKDYLYKALDGIIDLLSAKEIEKDRVNMSLFKKLIGLVKEMTDRAFIGKSPLEKFTINDENQPSKDMGQQETAKEDDFHEK